MTNTALSVAKARPLPKHVEHVEEGVDRELNTRGRYQVCMELASGGMGTVYLALYRGVDGFERVVALKRMHEHLSSQARFVEMFFNEAQAMARVQHPAICGLIDLGTFNDSYYLAMEYLEGEPMSAIGDGLANSDTEFESPRLPMLIARIVSRLCDGLHAIHQTRDEHGKLLQLVHCDITPHNLFVLYDGTVRVTDFGIARANGALKRGPGATHGKVPYMAPEQLTGAEPDCRADVWSMGVVLWEMLTRAPLFDGRGANTLVESVLSKPIASVCDVNPSVPEALGAIVSKALERNPTERFQTAQQLGLALESFLGDNGDSVPAGDVGSWLQRLFPGHCDDRRALRAMARAIGDQLMPPSIRPLSDLRTNSLNFSAWKEQQATRELTMSVVTDTDAPPTTAQLDAPVAAPAQPKAAQTWNIVAAVVFVIAGGLVVAGLSASKTRPSVAATQPSAAPAANLPPQAAPPAAPSQAPQAAPTQAQAQAPAVAPPAAAAAPLQAAAAQPAATQPASAAVTPPPAAAPPASAESASPPPTAAVAPPAQIAPPAAAAKAAAASAATKRREPAVPSEPKPSRGKATATSSGGFVATGSIYVLSNPGPADVLWQERLLGVTPVRIRLPAGDQTLRLRAKSSGSVTTLDVHIG
jgi:serine/threonine protein kinase